MHVAILDINDAEVKALQIQNENMKQGYLFYSLQQICNGDNVMLSSIILEHPFEHPRINVLTLNGF